jgi:hypothetical protein
MKGAKIITGMSVLVLIACTNLHAQTGPDTLRKTLRVQNYGDSVTCQMVGDTERVRTREMVRNQGDTIQMRVENRVRNRAVTTELTSEKTITKDGNNIIKILKRVFTKRDTVTVQKEVGSGTKNTVRNRQEIRVRDENADGIPDSLQVRDRERLRLRDGSCTGAGSQGSNSRKTSGPVRRVR